MKFLLEEYGVLLLAVAAAALFINLLLGGSSPLVRLIREYMDPLFSSIMR